MVLLLRKAARGGGVAATSKCFVPFRHDQRALRSPFGNLRPITPQTMWYPTLAGRGGSVSRRDRDRAHRRHAQLAGGTNDEERINSNASRFPEGSAREGPFSERPPPSQYAKRWQVAAALSAAVTATELIGDAPNSQAEPTPKKRSNPNASYSSEEGVWGSGASLREAASPPESPSQAFTSQLPMLGSALGAGACERRYLAAAGGRRGCLARLPCRPSGQ